MSAADQVPLYIGIPLAILCIVVSVAGAALAISIWRERR